MNKKIIYTPDAPEPIGPYSQAVKAGNTLFVSGQIPFEAGSATMVDGGIEDQTHQVMKNISAILQAAGGSFENVVKCSIFVKDMNDFGKINQVYGEYFTTEPPARETVEVARLPKDVGVEISCIAILA